jgi:DNA-binding winged helix-turn-helix (wHTH) protein
MIVENQELLIAVTQALELAITRSEVSIVDGSADTQYSFGPFTLDPAARTLTRDGEAVPLGAKPFDLLVFLVQRRGQVISKEDLFRGVWPDCIVDAANLPQNIFFLRKILGEKAGDNRYISTLPGRGYSFVAALRQHRSCQVPNH